MPLNSPILVEGVRVTFLDANHCPGAVMILFEPPGCRPVLHTGWRGAACVGVWVCAWWGKPLLCMATLWLLMCHDSSSNSKCRASGR